MSKYADRFRILEPAATTVITNTVVLALDKTNKAIDWTLVYTVGAGEVAMEPVLDIAKSWWDLKMIALDKAAAKIDVATAKVNRINAAKANKKMETLVGHSK